VGHRVVARIAEQHLTPKAEKRLARYLGKEVSLADVALWADEIREEREETKPWHYINLPPDAKTLDLNRDCPGGGCITVKLREFEGIARLAVRDKEEVAEALKFAVHLVGDVHMPLHAGYAADRGGNDIPVLFFGEEDNLHAVWDSGILKRLGDEEEILAAAQALVDEESIKKWSKGNARQWTLESHELAARIVRGALPVNGPRVLTENYVEEARPVVIEQLAKAGVRLAAVMNRIWP